MASNEAWNKALLEQRKTNNTSFEHKSPYLDTSPNRTIHEKWKSFNASSKGRPYANQTGPGDYDLPDLWKGNVSFSFWQKVNPGYMGKTLTTDLVGKESPPLTKYNAYDYKTI